MPTPFARNIVALRRRLDLSQRAFARSLDVSQPAVHKWEQGLSEPSADKLEVLARMAGMTVAEFRYGNGGKMGDPAAPPEMPVTGYVVPGGSIHFVAAPVESAPVPEADPAAGLIAVKSRGVGRSDGWTFYLVDPRVGKSQPVKDCVGAFCVVVDRKLGETYLGFLELNERNKTRVDLIGFMGLKIAEGIDPEYVAPILWMRP